MNNMITKLSSVAALLGVVGAIGAGFVQYGKLTAKIDELDKREAVINQSVDLDPLHEKISELEVDLIDRIKQGDKEVEAKIKPQDLSGLLKSIQEVREQVAAIRPHPSLDPIYNSIKALETIVTEAAKQIAIALKENELQDVQIKEIKKSTSNPLGG